MRAVQFQAYGGIEVLQVEDVPEPAATVGGVLVRVRTAGINPGEASIRKGLLDDRFPATFPSGEGTDFAGIVAAVGDGVDAVAVGDEVLGWSEERSSQAEYVAVPATQVVTKPSAVSWEVAGSLFVAACAAWGGVTSIDPRAGQTVVVSGASGGVGLLAVQLFRERDVRVVGIASASSHAELERHGAVGVAYGDDLEADLRSATPDGIDGWFDASGDGYVDLAVRLGVPTSKIDTIIDFAAAARHEGVQTVGTHQVGTAEVLAGLAARVADGRLQVSVAATYPLEQVREAFTQLEQGHTHGKIVLTV